MLSTKGVKLQIFSLTAGEAPLLEAGNDLGVRLDVLLEAFELRGVFPVFG